MKPRAPISGRAITWAALVFVSLFGSDLAHAQPGGTGSPMKFEHRTLSVRGVGKVSAKPDTVHIQLGVTSEAPTALQALAKNNEAMNRLFQVVKERGIAERDIQTSHINVMPQYSQPRPPRPGEEQREFIPRIIGYRVDNSVTIRSREISKLGPLLDAVVEGGANQVNGIHFKIDDPEKLLYQARKEAMADAKAKATLIAGEAGMVVGSPLKIDEEGGHMPVVENFGSPRMMRMAAAPAAMPVAAGEQDLSVAISVIYEIKVP